MVSAESQWRKASRRGLTSGTKRSTSVQPIICKCASPVQRFMLKTLGRDPWLLKRTFQAAYQPKAPCGVNARKRAGNVKAT